MGDLSEWWVSFLHQLAESHLRRVGGTRRACSVRVLVCGGQRLDDAGLRHFSRRAFSLFDSLHLFSPIVSVVGAMDSSASMVASSWSHSRRIRFERFVADWSTHGRRAQLLVNDEAVSTCPDLVLAFHGGRWSNDIVERSYDLGLCVFEVRI